MEPVAVGGAADGRGLEVLAGWQAGAEALVLLKSAMACGVIEACRAWCTVPKVAIEAGLDESQADRICRALHAHGVLVHGDAGYMVSPEFFSLTDPDRHQRLDDVLDAELVRLQAVAACGAPSGNYLALDDGDRFAMARNAGAISEALIAGVNRAFAEVADVVEIWQGGGRHLELGCGVGCQLLSPLVAHPELEAVGVELSAAVAAETRRRAAVLGVSDRVEVRVADASGLDDVEAFDTAYWSQPFFSRQTRAAVLAAARRALKPDGILFAPILFERPAGGSDPASAGERRWRMNELVFGQWNIPVLSPGELGDELRDAGFVEVRTVSVEATSDGSVLAVSRFVVALKPGAVAPLGG